MATEIRIPRKLKKKLKKRYFNDSYLFPEKDHGFKFAVINQVDKEGFIIQGFRKRKDVNTN